jgi:hypothetical protein
MEDMAMNAGRTLVLAAMAAICVGAAPVAHAADDEAVPPEISRIPKPLRSGFFKRFIDKSYFWRLNYYFVAQNAASCDLFYGLVQDDPFIGRASVDFIFPNGCKCRGYALVNHYPKGHGVVGQRGFIHAKCSDGRTIKGNFETTSLTTGNGTAHDNQGNQYQFTFGHNAEQAVAGVNELRKKLGCPECTPEDIELKVQGKVIIPKPAQ